MWLYEGSIYATFTFLNFLLNDIITTWDTTTKKPKPIETGSLRHIDELSSTNVSKINEICKIKFAQKNATIRSDEII